MKDSSNKKSKSVIIVLLLLMALLTFFFFWERKNNLGQLSIANQNVAKRDALLNTYQEFDRELLVIISKYDSTSKPASRIGELAPILDAILSRYAVENKSLKILNLQESGLSLTQQKTNDTLRLVIQSLEGKLKDIQIQATASSKTVNSLTRQLGSEKSLFDSLSSALEKKLILTTNALSDSLNLVSPKGINIFYYGKIKNKEPNGFGVGFYEKQGHYVGEWKASKRFGYGKHFFKDGSIYEGHFKDDERVGYGTYYYPTGEVYQGNWENNLMNGSGELTDTDGKKLKGTWKDGKLLRK